MAVEIEYRFLLRRKPALDGLVPRPILQGYLSTDPERIVRARLAGMQGFLTVKGRKTGAGAAEFEYPIPPGDAKALIGLCADTLTKDRYALAGPDGKTWDVDIFTGRHAGLMIAEIELAREDEAFDLPEWLDGMDITTDPRFSNAALVRLKEAEVQKLMKEKGL